MSLRLLRLSLDGDRLLLVERLLLPFLRLFLRGDRLRLRDDGPLPDLRPLGEAFFEEIVLGGDFDLSRLRLILPLLLFLARLLSFPLSLAGDLLEDRLYDLLGERSSSFPLPLGGDLLEFLPLGGDWEGD